MFIESNKQIGSADKKQEGSKQAKRHQGPKADGAKGKWAVNANDGRGVHLEDGSCLQHLSHEGGNPPELAVPCPHPSKDTVPDGDACLITRHKAAYLCHQHIHSHLQSCHCMPVLLMEAESAKAVCMLHILGSS